LAQIDVLGRDPNGISYGISDSVIKRRRQNIIAILADDSLNKRDKTGRIKSPMGTTAAIRFLSVRHTVQLFFGQVKSSFL
jgi:hypothetical protein